MGSMACVLALLPAAPGWAVESAPDVAVTPEGPGALQHPQIAIDPKDDKRLVTAYHEGQDHSYCGLARSQDGGKTWANERVVGAGTPFALPPDADQCYDPMVAFGPDGTLYYHYQTYPGTNPLGQREAFIMSSRGGGAFEAPTVVDPVGPGADRTDLYSELIVDPRTGRVYISWLRYCEPSVLEPRAATQCFPEIGRYEVVSSTDGARTFSAPVKVNSPASANPGRSSLALDSAGTLYAAWIDGYLTARRGGSEPRMFVSTSRDEGKTFTDGKQVTNVKPCEGDLCYSGDAGSGGFFHAVGGKAGELNIVFWEKEADKNRLFFTRTRDGGASFSPPRKIGVPAGGEDQEQHHPRMTLAPDGRIYILYYSFRPDGFHEVYLIDSTDGGQTFSAPRKLSDAPSNARIGPNGGELANFSQRIGLAVNSGGALAAWTDSRRGTEVDGKNDIFFEAVPAQGAPGTGTGTGAGSGRFTAKLAIARARILRRGRRLDVLAPITRRASGSVRVELHAAGRRTRFSARIDSARGRIRFSKRIPASQADLGTGIVTITYGGDADTRPQVVRLRAASQRAALRLSRPRIVGGRLRASGTVTRRARGVVRVQLEYDSAGRTTTLQRNARISNGRWRLNAQLSSAVRDAIAKRQGTVHSYTLFTGYFPRRVRGEMRSFQVLGNP